jgi:excisionase family DNA binding protein
MTTERPTSATPTPDADEEVAPLRVGQAAEMLGVTVETLRRWEADGRLHTTRSAGGQRLVPIAEGS